MNSDTAAGLKDILCKTLPKDFNKKKNFVSFGAVNNPLLSEIQSLGRKQCLGRQEWHQIDKIKAWMISAETATFMKWGGLGMVASEMPEAFNSRFSANGESIAIVTPMYIGDTGKKKAFLDGNVYHGAEKKEVNVNKIMTLKVSFAGDGETIKNHNVAVYTAFLNGTDYIFLYNERFFSITPGVKNNPAQDGCYVLNEHNINEVERFAFFSKAVYELICELNIKSNKKIPTPNVLVANDWHSGALSGLTKYLSPLRAKAGIIDLKAAETIKNIPVIHLAHHLGYQGWDYENTARILNSLYGEFAAPIFKNAKAIKNSNPRALNTLIVYDCYNQSSCNFHLADRVVTVSKNYMEEVSKELDFGLDFRDILKIRKDHRNFFGIVNGYEKKLIAPNLRKIEHLNDVFAPFKFAFYDENDLQGKLKNKQELIKLLSRLANDDEFKNKVIPLVDIYKFDEIKIREERIVKTPIICATSRLVEQKGYDIAAQSIIDLANRFSELKNIEPPIFILGGAGSSDYFAHLTNLKDKIQATHPKIGKRIFVFRGYQDDFAYSIQLASDFYMMPCRFEPCGLTQMEAMAKGALPVAMSTGGLVDTIIDGEDGFRTKVFFSPSKRRVYGDNLSAQRLKNNVNAYTETLRNALKTFYWHHEKIVRMRLQAMHKDFGWNVENGSISKYYRLFKTGHI
ncbi:MAG: glycogen/starch synthase [Alphaproteobacteria bacterium]|nr:glycogen/starch synthase [Alphaproteobacteria bacterium]